MSRAQLSSRERFAARVNAMAPIDPEDRKDPDHRLACVLDTVSRLALLADRSILHEVLREIDFERWKPDEILAAFRVMLELGQSEDRDGMVEKAAGAIRKSLRENRPIKVRDSDSPAFGNSYAVHGGNAKKVP